MNIFEAIEQRRAVKHFDPDHAFTEKETEQLINLAIQSPTSFNIQHWRFVNVVNPEQRKIIRAAAWDQAQVTDASLLIVLCTDIKAWDHNPAQYWRSAPKEAQDMLVPMIKPFYQDKPELQRDEAMRSVGIVAQTIMLAAKGMGYDSCPMIGFDPDAVADIIQLPEDYAIGMMITIGKATKPAWPKPGQLPLDEVLITDSF